MTQKICHLRSTSYISNFGRTYNCAVEVFLKWSDQSHTLSPPLLLLKHSRARQHRGILALVRCNNLVTTLMSDITSGWGCFWCMHAYVCLGGGVLCLFVFPVRLLRGGPVYLFSPPKEPLSNFHDGSHGVGQ